MKTNNSLPFVESSVRVYFSRDYKIFGLLKGNRLLNEGKIKKILDDIKNGTDFLKYVPIVVNNNFEILDGQHRFYVSKKLGRPVYYIVADDIDIIKVAKVNSRASNWKHKDYLDTWITMGVESYIELEAFMNKFKVSSFTLASALVHSGRANSRESKELFIAGQLTTNGIEEARKIMTIVSRFSFLFDKPQTNFVSAIEFLLEKEFNDWDELIDKCKKQPETWSPTKSKKEVLDQLEKLYNYRMRERRRLY